MGISIKTAGGIVIGGIFGFYLVNKAVNYASRAISELAETSKWRAYYKYGKDGKMVPPGYSEMPVPGDENREYVHPKTMADREKKEQEEARKAEREERKNSFDTSAICESIEKVAKAYLKTKGIDMDDNKNKPNTPYYTYARYSDRCEEQDKAQPENEDKTVAFDSQIEKTFDEAENEEVEASETDENEDDFNEDDIQ